MRPSCFAFSLLAFTFWLTANANGQITAQPAPSVRSGPVFNPTYPGYLPPPPLTSPVSAYPSSNPSILQSPEANSIRGWYRDYLGRDVGTDLSALANLLRGGMSPIDLQATVLGSDEYYYQKGRDPQTFVRETLQAVNWTEPSYADVQRWTARLAQLRNDRFALAREILLEGQSSTSTENQAWREVASRLPAAARLAVDTIQFEIAGTPQGRQANLQAVALLDAVNRLDQLSSSGRTPDALAALDGADRSLNALRNTLANPPGTAPSAGSVVRRIGTMLADARASLNPASAPSRPTYPLPRDPSVSDPLGSSWQLTEQVSSARRAAESLIQVLTSQSYQDYAYNIILRDLDSLASRLASLESLARTGASRDRLAVEMQTLNDSAQRVQSQLTSGRLPYAARLYWESLQSSLAQLRESVGVANNSTVSLRPTAWHENLVSLLDQAAAQIDVFLAGTTPLIYRLPEVPSVQADSRSLRNRVMTLREQAAYGQAAPALKQTLTGMVGDYKSAFDRWNRLVATNQIPNPPRLSPVGEILNRVELQINESLTSSGVTAGSSSSLGIPLAQLNSEVSEARRSLYLLAGYREQQSLDLYLEQIAGYVTQFEQTASRQSSLDTRRLAVGMQGVVGRLQTEIDTLSRNPAAAAIAQPLADLRSRALRIGRLADEVETLLY